MELDSLQAGPVHAQNFYKGLLSATPLSLSSVQHKPVSTDHPPATTTTTLAII